MATLSSILAWRISRPEEPGGLQSMGTQRVRHDWVAENTAHTVNTAEKKAPLGSSPPALRNKAGSLQQLLGINLRSSPHSPWEFKREWWAPDCFRFFPALVSFLAMTTPDKSPVSRRYLPTSWKYLIHRWQKLPGHTPTLLLRNDQDVCELELISEDIQADR